MSKQVNYEIVDDEQLQIGDRVTYTPEKVRATVTGYIWTQARGEPPKILMYELDCGIEVTRDLLERRR